MKKNVTLLIVLAVVLVLAGGTGGFFAIAHFANGKPAFRTSVVERGDLTALVTATGTLQPEEVIDIGAQVQGMIKEFGPDLKDPSKRIDYCSEVEKGTVLAKIDESLYAAAVQKAEAEVGQAEANLRRAQADLQALRAKLTQTERDKLRVEKLRTTRALSDFEIDAAQNAYDSAKAALAAGEAAVLQAERAVDTAKAVLNQASLNLGYCTIKSPVKGVIIDRRVNVGQTVVASLNAPSLFLLAKDLRRIQIWASVNEADIGNIKVGQKATFTVDAFPKAEFDGEVVQVRLNASNTNNVVTYTVVVATDNSSGQLLPYLTANLRFKVKERQDVLKVSNIALRWRPNRAELVVPEAREEYARLVSRRPSAGGRRGQGKTNKNGDESQIATLWVPEGHQARPIRVRTGITDGTMTEIVEILQGELDENSEVIEGERLQQSGSDSTNPFAPPRFQGKQRQEERS